MIADTEIMKWNEARELEVTLQPKYGVEGEDLSNVWSGEEPSEQPRENP
jgi:hypothetical protein